MRPILFCDLYLGKSIITTLNPIQIGPIGELLIDSFSYHYFSWIGRYMPDCKRERVHI